MIDNTDSDFVIENENSGKYLEIKSALTTENADAGQWGVTNNWCQKWTFEDAGNGYYRIKNMNSGLYLEIENQSKENGAKAIQCKYSNRASQLWKLVENGDGYYFIITTP